MHYRVTVNISASIESSSHGGDVGRLWMILISRNGTFSEKIPLEEHTGYWYLEIIKFYFHKLKLT